MSGRLTLMPGCVLMIDLIYIVATIGFFALMLAYVRGCERLGRQTTDTTEKAP